METKRLDKRLDSEEMESLLQLCVVEKVPCKHILNERDHRGRTLLHWTIMQGLGSEVEYLITQGASLNIADDEGRTPLHYAAESGALDSAKILIERGADPNSRDARGRTPLHYAARSGHAQIVALLLQYGADPNVTDAENNTPLHYAENSEIVELLLNSGADPNALSNEGLPPIYYVKDCKGMMLLLSRTNRDLLNIRDEHGVTLLHLAARHNCVEAARILVEFIDVNSRDVDGNTPLHDACIYENIEMIKLLLASNADVKMPNNNGIRPLEMIAGMCRKDIPCAEILEMVLEKVDIDTIMKAAFNVAQLRLLQLLLRRGLLSQKALQI